MTNPASLRNAFAARPAQQAQPGSAQTFNLKNLQYETFYFGYKSRFNID